MAMITIYLDSTIYHLYFIPLEIEYLCELKPPAQRRVHRPECELGYILAAMAAYLAAGETVWRRAATVA